MLQQEIWREHYRNLHPKRTEVGKFKSMDYPNDRLQAYTYAIVLEALGRLNGQSFLDAGCGWGVLSLMAHSLGATVVGMDFVPETIQTLREAHPMIQWETANVTDPAELAPLGVFDRVAAVEVLQCVDFRSAVSNLWKVVAPRGRLVGCVPNSLCPFAQEVHRRLTQWIPVAPGTIESTARQLPGCSAICMKGLTYLEDQTFLPYAASDWGPKIAGTPNRIVFAMLRGQ